VSGEPGLPSSGNDVPDVSAPGVVGSDRHAFGAAWSQTGAPPAGIVVAVGAVGGGFIPTLNLGGGAEVSLATRCPGEARS
jgi:hypothetical protein